eukprot:scaffold38062_cov194-Skeletonema_dohrnii-CCMP3373.AAC.1
MLTFFGMRRRLRSSRRGVVAVFGGCGGGMLSLLRDMTSFWKGIDDGNAALGLVIVSHLLASLVLAPNGTMEDGCKISLPSLAGVVVLVAVLFFRGVKGHFLPMDQRARIEELRLGGGGMMGSHHVE